MTRSCPLVCLLFVVCFSIVAEAVQFTEDEYQQRFLAWTHEHEKHYGSAEFLSRYETFKKNMDFVYNWNEKHTESTMALNLFADLGTEEFGRLYTNYHGNKNNRPTTFPTGTRSSADVESNARVDDKREINSNLTKRGKPSCPAPATSLTQVDWTSTAVTPVKNQGQCGSCWAFSSTGAIEGDVFIEAGALTSLSEQQLVDCSTAQGNLGCNGGLMDSAFQYVISNGGLTTEAGYPYTATGPNTCNVQTPLVSTITNYCDVTSGSEAALLNAVAQQPVSVAIEADQSCFQFYSTGVMSDPSCGTQLDHGVLAVGYGVLGGQKYWTVKNSWGTSWGSSGYILLGRQVAGQPLGVCGIASEPSFPYGGKSLK